MFMKLCKPRVTYEGCSFKPAAVFLSAFLPNSPRWCTRLVQLILVNVARRYQIANISTHTCLFFEHDVLFTSLVNLNNELPNSYLPNIIGHQLTEISTCNWCFILHTGKIPLRQLVYRVLDLPPSMRPLVYDFGQLNTDTEQDYIKQIVHDHVWRCPVIEYHSFIHWFL